MKRLMRRTVQWTVQRIAGVGCVTDCATPYTVDCLADYAVDCAVHYAVYCVIDCAATCVRGIFIADFLIELFDFLDINHWFFKGCFAF